MFISQESVKQSLNFGTLNLAACSPKVLLLKTWFSQQTFGITALFAFNRTVLLKQFS